MQNHFFLWRVYDEKPFWVIVLFIFYYLRFFSGSRFLHIPLDMFLFFSFLGVFFLLVKEIRRSWNKSSLSGCVFIWWRKKKEERKRLPFQFGCLSTLTWECLKISCTRKRFSFFSVATHKSFDIRASGEAQKYMLDRQ